MGEQHLSLKKKSGREFWISAFADSITKGLIDKAHKSGIKVNAWTLTSNNQAAQFYQWGIDSITTNGYVNVKNYLESQTNPGTTSTYASAGAPEKDLSDDAAAAGAAIEEPVSDAQEDGSAQETDGQGTGAAGEDAAVEKAGSALSWRKRKKMRLRKTQRILKTLPGKMRLRKTQRILKTLPEKM